MIRTALALLPLGLTAVLAAQRAAPPPRPAVSVIALRGQVRSADDGGAPVPRARITVDASGSRTVLQADAEGRFEIRVPPSKRYTLSLAKGGFVPLSVPLMAPASAGSIEMRLSPGAIISGTLIDAGGHAVVAAGVTARPAGADRAGSVASSVYTTTDDLGQFRFSSLRPGRYELYSLRGFDTSGMIERLNPELSERTRALARQLLPTSVPLSEVSTVEAVSGREVSTMLVHHEPAVILTYARIGGVITGEVHDEWGDAVEGARVQLWTMSFSGGRQQARPTLSARETDERGRYRLFHVPPGRYVVAATPPEAAGGTAGGSVLAHFHPGRTSLADALQVRIRPTQEVFGIDIAVSGDRGSRVFGRALTSSGAAATDGVVSLATSARSGAIAIPPRSAQVAPDGSFEFLGVPPGEYVARFVAITTGVPFRVSTGVPAPEPPVNLGVLGESAREFGSGYVTVAGADTGPVTLRSVRPATIRGRLVFEGPAQFSPSDMSIGAAAADPDLATDPSGIPNSRAAIDPDGTFRLPQLYGLVRVVLMGARGWWIKSAYVRAVDAAEEPVDVRTRAGLDDVTIVLANTAATVSGRVADAGGRPVDEYWALVFATDPRRWFAGSPYVRNAYADQDGRFSVSSLPPGEYWVVAVDAIDGDSESGEWQSAELLTRLAPLARRVTLSEGERATTETRLVAIDTVR